MIDFMDLDVDYGSPPGYDSMDIDVDCGATFIGPFGDNLIVIEEMKKRLNSALLKIEHLEKQLEFSK